MIAQQLATGCKENIGRFRAYFEGNLSSQMAVSLLQHLKNCSSCAQEFGAQQQVFALLDQTYNDRKISQNFDKGVDKKVQALRDMPKQPSLSSITNAKNEEALLSDVAQPSRFNFMFGATPWWFVSIALHALIILLAGLISMSLEMPTAEEAVVVVTELQPATQIKQIEPEKPKVDNRVVLESKHDTPPTDPDSSDPSDIVVPPEVLAMAELGDHWETINLDRPDTHSAFGNPESHIFYDKHGNDEPEGGGGQGGCSLDNLIGVGGNASPGSGGGWGGGHGTGIGVGTGPGKGSFGSRTGGGRRWMVKKHGGSRATEAGVDFGLEWLARNQEADGHWNSKKHGGTECGVPGNAAMTGFALLAFLGAGHTEKVGKYKDNVQRGVKWLIEQQTKDGKWYPRNGGIAYGYTQGITTMALGEAAGMARVPETKKAAQLAINAVEEAQNKTGPTDREAWDYGSNVMNDKILCGTNDSSIMAWNIMALKSCKVAGLSVSPAAFEGCLNWLNAGQDLGNHQPLDIDPYFEGGKMSYRGTCAVPNKGSHTSSGYSAVTAAAGLCRMMIGGASGDTVGVAGPCNLILKELIPTKYPFNLYFGYYATLLMFQKGGDHWKTWNAAMKKVLLEAQCKGGQDDGSWNPKNAGSVDNCRVMSTALAILCLEVYYRYAKLAPGNAIKN